MPDSLQPATSAVVQSPPLAQVSGWALRRALIAGARKVQRSREHLNRINVFPVADGDTGTNLAFTMEALIDGMRPLRASGSGAVLEVAAQVTLDGARGNSGAIVAQFFHGLAQACRDQVQLSAESLARAARHAAAQARAAIAEPREGTVLSVITDYADSLQQLVDRGVRDLRTLLADALASAKSSLAQTPSKLPVLRRAGVVDAGAQGFVDFLEGVSEYVVSGRRLAQPADQGAEDSGGPLPEGHGDSAYRYCTECVVEGEGLDPAAARAVLKGLAMDSLVVVGGGHKLRLHAHLDQPGELFDALLGVGKVSARKADDMRAQQRARQRLTRVAVVTDSAADLPESESQRLGILVVPVRVGLGQEDYLDKITMRPTELYARMRRGESPRTSQPPSIDFKRQFELLDDHHEGVVCINISSRLSGTYQAAALAARPFEERITAIDSLNVASGQALLAMYAAEGAQRGMDAAAIVSAVKAMMKHTRTYALVEDLSYGARGGRMPGWTVPLSRALGARIRIEDRGGRIRPAGLHFGNRERALEKFVRRVARPWQSAAKPRAMVSHCDAAADAERCLQLLRQQLPNLAAAWISETGPAVGAHAGPGTVVIALQDWRAPS
ncbi:MAG: DegV family EDD domain-containing protein [Xanthomonadales bacterium]|nr:DegV family EDD domain-containing protein [Xanthomonadales bacterium]